MNRAGTFAFRVSDHERRAIAGLAVRLQRTQSDAVRFVVTEAAKQLSKVDSIAIIGLPTDDPKQEGSHVTD